MNIYDYENRNKVSSEKLEKNQFYCFHPWQIGVLCGKTLNANGHI